MAKRSPLRRLLSAKPSMLHYVESLHEWRFDQLEEFVQRTKENREKEWENYCNEFDEITKGMDDEEKEYYVDAIYDDLSQERDILPRLSNYSILLLVYSFIEHELGRIANALYRDGKIRIKKPTKQGHESILGYHYRCICKSSKFKISQIKKHYQYIENLRPIRNCVAHNDGNGSKIKSKDKSKLAKPPYEIDFPQLGQVGIPTKTIEQMLDHARKLADGIYSQFLKRRR